jgi:sugar lactone lactonase YvrE
MRTCIWLAAAVLGFCASNVSAGPVMFGGLGGHGAGSDSTNDGALVTLNQTTGDVSVVGHPTGVARLTGIAFDSGGALFGSTIGAIPFPPPPQPSTSDLIRINPKTGALISDIGPITDGAGGPAISIADLATQPGSGTLFGVRSPVGGEAGAGNLYTIDKTTGVASLIGSTGHFFDSIAFAPDGTLYMTAADLGPMGAELNPALLTLDPTNAQVLKSVSTSGFYGALGVRPSDGTIFAGNGDGAQIFTLDAATGAATALAHTTGTNFVGDIDFASPSAATIPLPPAVVPGLAMLLVLLLARYVMSLRVRNIRR